MTTDFVQIEELPRRTSTEVKNQWSALAREVRARGSVAVTHHGKVEAVIMDADAYRKMAALVEETRARDRATLVELAAEFDRHLELLRAPAASERAAAAMDSRGRVRPRPKAGAAF
jgi:prevent-host-death family protein